VACPRFPNPPVQPIAPTPRRYLFVGQTFLSAGFVADRNVCPTSRNKLGPLTCPRVASTHRAPCRTCSRPPHGPRDAARGSPPAASACIQTTPPAARLPG